ncbi:PAS domain S-box protein [Lutibacter sp. B1]|uniref:PAS domain S-box protein n=1 Tax=Lutibacter sp. B1 TaxID=2725996 RepID=UPI00145796AC|nr:PAS domain S-box protein [Lutibacter sp. B1]NLP57326.1 PAS domain S-box protein [Lutibacter sp. B1]
MKGKENKKNESIDFYKEPQNSQNITSTEVQFKKYFNFFEHAPIALWIEDFSKVKRYIDEIAAENNKTVKAYILDHLEIVPELASMITIKEANAAAVNLYKAKNKTDLYENINKCFTNDSNIGFANMLKDVLLGKLDTEVETINRNFEGELIYILIKFKVADGDENTLENVVVSVENITERIKVREALLESEHRYKEAQSIAKIGSWFYDFKTKELYWSEEAYKMLGIEPNAKKLTIDFYLSFVHEDDRELVQNFSIKSLLANPNQNLQYRVITSNGELKHIFEKRTVIIENNRIIRIIGIGQDITESVIAEQKLNETKNLFSNTLSSIKDGFVILDNDLRYTYANKEAGELLGRKAEELLGKHLWTEFPEKEGDIFYDNTIKAIETKKPVSFENYFETWDKWFENRIIPSNEGVIMFFQEITDKKNTENKIKEAYNIINKSSSVAILCKNEWDFPVVFASENTIDLFSYKYNKLLKNKIKIHQLVYPDDLNYIRTEIFKLIKSENSKGIKPQPFRIITKNGKVKWIQCSIDVIRNSSNKITHIQGIVEDISERIKKEALENVLYNISKEALINNDFNKYCLYVKQELHKIIDTNNFYIALYNEESDTITTPFISSQEEETPKEFPAKDTLTGYVIKTKKPLLVNKDIHNELIEKGKVKLVGVDSKIWIGVPLKIGNKVFGAIVVQSYDNENAYNEHDLLLLEFVADQISTTIQRKKVENELKEALIKAQESDRLKSSFLSNMSHEIRTPMNGIIGFSELFLDANISESKRKEYAKIVINSSKQLLSIVNDILDFSKIEAGAIKLVYESVNINKLLDDLFVFFRPSAELKNLTLSCVKDLENNKSYVQIDKTKLNQVLTNLLSNAFKFTYSGGVEFGYKFLENKLQFYVKDTGIGIEEKLQEKIFERFIQANLYLNKHHKGTGLGLSISKKFVELFNGEIWIDSNNKGTTVYFTIPYIKPKEKAITTVIENNKPAFYQKRKELTILITDDEEYNMMYLKELFSKTNFKILEADNGKKAVELFQKHPEIDLVLMDIKMPVMNGNEAMKEIKKLKSDIPVIALSAFAIENEKDQALKKGFDFYLTKPINKKILFDIINKYSK